MNIHKKSIVIPLILCALVVAACGGDIHKAAEEGDIGTVISILGENPELVNVKDEQGMTPICKAAYYGNFELVKLLIDKGADINIRDENGFTPLHFSGHGNKKVVELLIANGADVNAKEALYSRTPLHFAGNAEIAKLLISNGADVNARDSRGMPLMHSLVIDGPCEIIKAIEVLIVNGADVNARDSDGYTLLKFVTKGKGKKRKRSAMSSSCHNDTADLLRRHGAVE